MHTNPLCFFILMLGLAIDLMAAVPARADDSATNASTNEAAQKSEPSDATPDKVTPDKVTPDKATTDKATTDKTASEKSAAAPGHRVVLNFRDEEWLPALEWLAKELKLNLDWQTLPEGKLSLFSTKDYEISEAEDLINMQLLARGFTLLKRGEVLRLVPLKDVDITLVPRVTPDELESLSKHQVVRVSIPLEWMVAENAAAEFRPLLSPYGQMFPMTSSNRLEVLDAVVNLRELVRLLMRAESDDGRRVRVLEFRLEHRRASEVAVQVRQLLGLPAEGSRSSSSQTQLDIEQARFKAEAVKQLGNNAKELITEKKQTDTFIVVNEKDNSIVVNAPPDKLEMVRQTIETLDKPLPPSDSSWQTVSRVKVHPVNGFDPQAITELLLSLQERGNLAKDARIQHEAAYNRIIAFASPEDQLTIAQLIESYRAEKRSASVIPLSTVKPQYAVKAVQLILKNPERPSETPGVASDGKFQIEADPDNNRLLVWATSDELQEVREFLISLGETFEQTDSQSQMHVLNVGASDVGQVTERLQKIWEDVSDAPLVIERKLGVSHLDPASDGVANPSPIGTSRAAYEEPAAVPSSSDRAADSNEHAKSPKNDQLSSDADSVLFVSSQTAAGLAARQESAEAISERPATDQAAKEGAVQPAAAHDVITASSNQPQADGPAAVSEESSGAAQPPVRIIEGKKGDVVIISRDPDAAATAKRLLQQLIPEPGDVRVITLKHAQAILVRRQLEEMLEHTNSGSSTSKLSTERPLSIEVDARTNRLIVQHCTAKQLELINEYITVIDQPPEGEHMKRQQRIYRVKHRRAAEVSEVVKEVYRDLLSVNDRSFASYDSRRPVGYNKNLAATASNPEYQGLMAIGTDTEANLLIISAPGYLIEEIVKLAESVDTPSDGPAMAVVHAAGDASDIKLREALSKILKKR